MTILFRTLTLGSHVMWASTADTMAESFSLHLCVWKGPSRPPPPFLLMCTAHDLAEHMLLSCPLCPAVRTRRRATLFSRVTGCLHFPAFCSEKNDEHRMVFCQQLCYKGNCVNARPQCVAKIPLCQIPYVCMRPGRPSYIL